MFDEGDGVPAWKERLGRTDPSDSNSVFQIDVMGLTSGRHFMMWQSFDPDPNLPPMQVQKGTNGVSGPWYEVENLMPVEGWNAWTSSAPAELDLPEFYRLLGTDGEE